jgi:cytidine deaminase
MDDLSLLEVAKEAALAAYAPYSKFGVGAALLTRSGEVITGCNVENASYGLSICAERVAVFKAVAAGLDDFVSMAIYTPTAGPASPCGACRQVLWEFAPDLQFVLGGNTDEVRLVSLRELLPGAFEL